MEALEHLEVATVQGPCLAGAQEGCGDNLLLVSLFPSLPNTAEEHTDTHTGIN